MSDSSPLPVSEAAIAAVILNAPHVTRLGLACPSDRLREQAADNLAHDIVARLIEDASQISLAL